MRTLYTIGIVMMTLSIQTRAQEYCAYDTGTYVNTGPETRERPTAIVTQADGWMLGLSSTIDDAAAYANQQKVGLIRFDINQNIDPSFADNGRFIYTWGVNNSGECMDLQADGKILVGGYQSPDYNTTYSGYVARLNSDGSIDETFGDEGSSVFDVTTEKAQTIGIKSMDDGTTRAIIQAVSPKGFFLIQFDESGQVDTNFNSIGYEFIPEPALAPWANSGSVIFTDDGGYMVLSFRSGAQGELGLGRPLLLKLDENGERDSLFNSIGELMIDENMDNAEDIYGIQDANGDIYIGCNPIQTNNGAPFVVFKFDGDTGAPIADFGINGRVESAYNPFHRINGIILEPQTGDLLVYGYGGAAQGTIWRLDSQTGEALTQCGSTDLWHMDVQYTFAFTAAAVAPNSTIQFLARGSGIDSTMVGVVDNNNIMIPHSSIPTTISEYDRLQFSVHPNPVTDHLTVDGLDHGLHHYTIIDSHGALVLQGSYTERIDLDRLATGLYHLSIISENGEMGLGSFFKE